MTAQNKKTKNEMDLTPMVDVAFLLLIFFMVTASFTVQESIAQPPLEDHTGSPVKVDDEPSFEVFIDQFNTCQLCSAKEEFIEAGRDQEMRVQMQALLRSSNAKKLKITAHGEAHHEKIVTAWDAAIDNHIDNINDPPCRR